MSTSRATLPTSRRNRQRGMTLIEILVVSALLLALLGTVNAVLSLSLHTYKPSLNYIDAQQQAMRAIRKITRELADAAENSITTDSVGVVFVSGRGTDDLFHFDSAGQVLWQRYVCYYVDVVDGTNKILRKEIDITPTTTVPDPVAYTPTQMQALTSVTATTVCQDVTSLTLTTGDPVQVEVSIYLDEDDGHQITLRGGTSLGN